MNRSRRTRTELQDLVRQFESSGMSRTQFAQLHGVTPAAVDYWLRRHGLADASTRPRLIEVRSPPERIDNAPCRIELPAGVRVCLPGLPPVRFLAELVSQLQGL